MKNYCAWTKERDEGHEKFADVWKTSVKIPKVPSVYNQWRFSASFSNTETGLSNSTHYFIPPYRSFTPFI